MYLVLQNFYRPTPLIRTTLRLRALIILINFPLIVTLLRHQWRTDFLYGAGAYVFLTHSTYDRTLFCRLGSVLRRTLLKKQRFFWHQNLLSGLKYWTFWYLQTSVSEITYPSGMYSLTETSVFNSYYYPTRLTNFGLINKFFRQVLFMFLLTLLPLWPVLTRSFRSQTKFLTYTSSLLLLPYYNTKIFKIHYV